MTQNKNSLTDRIREAQTKQDISDLLVEGSCYEEASQSTRNRWRKAAKKRRMELEA